MEIGTSITLVVTTILAIGAIFWVGLLVKMMVSGDYSILLPKNQQATAQSADAIAVPVSADAGGSGSVPNAAGLTQQIAVAHFMPELGGWNSDKERAKAADDLAEIKKRHRRAK